MSGDGGGGRRRCINRECGAVTGGTTGGIGDHAAVGAIVITGDIGENEAGCRGPGNIAIILLPLVGEGCGAIGIHTKGDIGSHINRLVYRMGGDGRWTVGRWRFLKVIELSDFSRTQGAVIDADIILLAIKIKSFPRP